MKNTTAHWNTIFKTTPHEKLGWFENDFNQTLKFIDKIGTINTKTIFIAGAGTTLLVDQLVEKCSRLILNDISDESLTIVKHRIADTGQNIAWIHADISEPLPIENETVDVWIDRAVLHFLTDEKQIAGYFDNLKSKLTVGGYAILAEFSHEGAPKCAGLELHRYSKEELVNRCGNTFGLVEHEHYNFVNPSGDSRPYIYTLFRKTTR